MKTADETDRTEAGSNELAGVVGRWRRFDRVGNHAGDTVVMTRGSWLALDPAGRPDATCDVAGQFVMFDGPAGWGLHFG